VKRLVAGAALALLGLAACAREVEPSDSFLCGPASTELFAKAGTNGIDRDGSRRVRFVLDEGMTPEQFAAWKDAVEDWRRAVEDSCPFVPEFVSGKTSNDFRYTGDSGNSPPKDVVELRVDADQPDEKEGNGWSWVQCRSGRATISAAPKNAYRTTRHELGHALGHLSHDETGEPSVMRVDGPDWWKISDIQPMDVANYARIWCPGPASPASGPRT
jgi:hypothetical protein